MSKSVEHFNKLTPAEAERLAILAEECAEVQQVVCKILRHGYASYNPFDAQQTTNRKLLQRELGHLQHANQMMVRAHDIDAAEVAKCCVEKRERIGPYLHHQDVMRAAAKEIEEEL